MQRYNSENDTMSKLSCCELKVVVSNGLKNHTQSDNMGEFSAQLEDVSEILTLDSMLYRAGQ